MMMRHSARCVKIIVYCLSASRAQRSSRQQRARCCLLLLLLLFAVEQRKQAAAAAAAVHPRKPRARTSSCCLLLLKSPRAPHAGALSAAAAAAALLLRAQALAPPLDRDAALDLAPPDQAPVLLDAPAERDLLAVLGAHRAGELQLGEVVLDGEHARAGAHAADVEHQHLALGQLRDLGLLLALLGAHAEQAAQQEKVDLELCVHIGQRADLTEHLADEAVGARERRVDREADADQAARHRVLQLVRLCPLLLLLLSCVGCLVLLLLCEGCEGCAVGVGWGCVGGEGKACAAHAGHPQPKTALPAKGKARHLPPPLNSPAKSETMRERIGVHVTLPSESFAMMPGRTSTSCPILSTPCRMLPPATPPLSSSTSLPGLFTSNELGSGVRWVGVGAGAGGRGRLGDWVGVRGLPRARILSLDPPTNPTHKHTLCPPLHTPPLLSLTG